MNLFTHVISRVSGAFKSSVFLFVALAFLLSLTASLSGFVRPVDGLKSSLWFFLISLFLLKTLTFLKIKNIALVFFLWVCFFCIDLSVQGVLRGFFGANPSPSIIAESLLNTTSNEMLGFVSSQSKPIFEGLAFVLFGLLLFVMPRRFYLQSMIQTVQMLPKWLVMLIISMAVALHFNPTMLRQQPLLRWPVVYIRHLDAQADIQAAQEIRSSIQATQSQWNVSVSPGAKTVVLVIGESDNRNNWSWYGYPRATSTPLLNALNMLGGSTTQLTQAKSEQAYTLPALRLALTPATQAEPDLWRTTPDVFLLSKAAGYKLTWLSNQVAHEGWLSLLGKNADTSVFVNSGNWRDSATTDFALLPELVKQLAAKPVEKELIVLHLLGQHFHYDLRCPKEVALRPYTNVDSDSVMQQMKSQGRTSSIRQSRNEYDNAVFCGSELLSQVLRQLNAKRQGRQLDFVYFSDHGQEVGHTQNYAGHSDASENGFSVPMFHWTNVAKLPAMAAYNQPYSTQYMDHMIQGVLGIKSVWYNANLDPLRTSRAAK